MAYKIDNKIVTKEEFEAWEERNSTYVTTRTVTTAEEDQAASDAAVAAAGNVGIFNPNTGEFEKRSPVSATLQTPAQADIVIHDDNQITDATEVQDTSGEGWPGTTPSANKFFYQGPEPVDPESITHDAGFSNQFASQSSALVDSDSTTLDADPINYGTRVSSGGEFDDDSQVIPVGTEITTDELVIPTDIGSIDPGTGSIIPGTTALGVEQVTENKEDPDWRVRLSLGEGAGVLYQSENPGILWPLGANSTGGKHGITFPYTPEIGIQYVANYENYDLIHSNHRGYFYRNSAISNMFIQATFTAQDTAEANYVLACMHFLRSCTKMFYGKDINRGYPPPLLFLHGYGEYGFDQHACAITNLQYNLPNDVDYIPAGKVQDTDPTSTFNAASGFQTGHVSYSQGISRLLNSGLSEGAENNAPPKTDAAQSNSNVGDYSKWAKVYEGQTYVPTKIDINFSLIPINTRKQVSTEFSLKDYASGKLLKPSLTKKNSGGFW